MKYETLDTQLQGRNRLKRKLGPNTYAQRTPDNTIEVWLHSTPILTFTPDRVTVKTGGWKTVTTKARLNEFLPHGYGIHQERGVWYWSQYTGNGQHSARVVFSDGDFITADGKLTTQAKPSEEKEQLVFRRKVNKFAALCESKVPLPMPGCGDCFYCQMVVSEGEKKGQSLGDASKSFGHLALHMEEGYAVPSMVFSALKEAGCGDLILASTFGQAGQLKFAGYVKRAVAKYLLKRKAMFGQ